MTGIIVVVKRATSSAVYIPETVKWMSNVFFDFSLTVNVAPHECVIMTSQPKASFICSICTLVQIYSRVQNCTLE